MTLASMGFVSMFTIVRILTESFSSFEIVFYRSLIGSALILPFLLKTGLGTFKTQHPWLFAFRALFSYLAMLVWFHALPRLPFLDAVALAFTLPFWTLTLAVLLLKESVGPRRWLATAIGFAGAMVVLRPGFAEWNPAALFVLGSAFLYAVVNVTIKLLVRSEEPGLVTFYGLALVIPLAAVPAGFSLTPLSLAMAPLLFGMGLAGALAHFFMTRAFAAADASVVSPFEFIQLPLAAMLGLILFGEMPDVWTLVGAAIIFASVTIMAQGEAKLAPEATE